MGQVLRASSTIWTPGQVKPNLNGARIDWSHPLANGLQSCCVEVGSGFVVDLAKPRSASSTTPNVRSLGSTAGAWSIPSAATTDLNFSSGGWSIAAIGYLSTTSGTSFDTLFGRSVYVDETNNQGWGVGIDTPNLTWRSFVFDNNGVGGYNTAGPPLTVGNIQLGISSDGFAGSLYVNGAAFASLGAVNVSPLTSAGPLTAGSALLEMYVGCAWSRNLSPAEMRQFYLDPYCFLSPAEGEMPAIMLPAAGAAARSSNMMMLGI